MASKPDNCPFFRSQFLPYISLPQFLRKQQIRSCYVDPGNPSLVKEGIWCSRSPQTHLSQSPVWKKGADPFLFWCLGIVWGAHSKFIVIQTDLDRLPGKVQKRQAGASGRMWMWWWPGHWEWIFNNVGSKNKRAFYDFCIFVFQSSSYIIWAFLCQRCPKITK